MQGVGSALGHSQEKGGELAAPSLRGSSTLLGALPRLWVQQPYPRFPQNSHWEQAPPS